MTKSEIADLFAFLATLYPRIISRVAANTQDGWYDMLKGYEYADVKQAVIDWNRGPRGRSFPDPRDVTPARKEPVEDRKYTGSELRQAWRQNCWAWAHTGPVPDGWEPSEFLLADMEQYAPGAA